MGVPTIVQVIMASGLQNPRSVRHPLLLPSNWEGGGGGGGGGGGEGVHGFIQDFREQGETSTSQLETVPITNVLAARIHLWKKSRCF